MVQTYQSPVRIYKYPFELVMAAYERRFPTSPLIPIFVGSEITEEYKSPDGAVHVIERKCKLNVDAPYILKKIAGVDYVYFMQKNSLDRRGRTLNIDAHNISFSSRIVINETCVYYVNQENPDWTCFEQTASLDVKSFFGFESAVEKLAMKQYAANISKGKEIIEHYLNELFAEDIKNMPRFEEGSNGAAITTGEEGVVLVSKKKESVEAFVTPRSGSIVRRVSLVNRDESSKLETEYIKRFLGELTPLEESRLCELRYWLHDNCKGKIPNDAHLLRFLRAREFDLSRAREMVVASMLWRKQHNVDKILSTYKPPNLVEQYFPGAWHGQDLSHRPLYIVRLGLCDIKGLLRSLGEEECVKFILSICEQGLKRTEEATKSFGVPINAWTLLVDLEGLSMRHLWRPGIRTVLKIIEIAEANYPETMGCALIVRAPRVFPVLWTLIGPFIDERTREKFMVYGGSDFLSADGGLKDYIDAKHVPDFLGGPESWTHSQGGHLPKSLYLHAEEPADQNHVAKAEDATTSHTSPGHILESIYETGYSYKGLPLEVAEPVASRGGVLTWDFDVVKGQCEFQILKVTRLISPDSVPQLSPTTNPLSALSPTGMLAAAGQQLTPQNPIAFDKTLTFGVDVFVAHEMQFCPEGESVQGSLICDGSCTYVLQWRFADDHHKTSTANAANQQCSIGVVGSHHSSFDFSLPLLVHKCRVMYHCELLDSDNFKGSVASLQSCSSSFSSLSNATINSKR